jgi:acyl carrier protein
MNKMLRFTAAATLLVLVSGMIFSLPLSAADGTDSSFEDDLRFTLQHRFNGGSSRPAEMITISFEAFENNPLVFFQQIKNNFSKQLERETKPLQIDSELKFLLSTSDRECFGQLPTLSLKTLIDKDGVGQSKVVFPAYRREVPETCGKGLIDWKGLDGQLSFTDSSENFTAALNLAGLTIKEEGVLGISLAKSTLSGTLDADWMPIKIDLNWPSLQVRNQDGQLDLQAMSVHFNNEKSRKGVDLGNTNFKVGHLVWTDADSKASLDDLLIISKGQEQNGVINYTLQTQIGQFVIPSQEPSKEAIEASLQAKLAFNRFDEESLLGLQTTARQLAEQEYHPMLPMIMLGEFMQVIPKLVAKSPEIAISQLTLKTSKGNLDGHLTIRLDGDRVTSLESSVLMAALQAQADLQISKSLLEQFNQVGDLSKSWLMDIGDNYLFIAEFKGGELTINDQVIPLPFDMQ